MNLDTSSAIGQQYELCLNKLNFIGQISDNTKVDISTNMIYKNDLLNSIRRSWFNLIHFNEESRKQTLKHIKMYQDMTVCLIEQILEKDDYGKSYIITIVDALDESCKGFARLKSTYSDDKGIIASIDTQISIIKIAVENFRNIISRKK